MLCCRGTPAAATCACALAQCGWLEKHQLFLLGQRLGSWRVTASCHTLFRRRGSRWGGDKAEKRLLLVVCTDLLSFFPVVNAVACRYPSRKIFHPARVKPALRPFGVVKLSLRTGFLWALQGQTITELLKSQQC